MEDDQFAQHVEAQNLTTTIITWLDEAKNLKNEVLRKPMIDAVKSIMKAMKLEFKPVMPYDELMNQGSTDDTRGVVSKIVSRIPKFTGMNDKYKWDSFYICFAMAVQNASYNEAELKAIFLQCLDGLALDHYQACFEEYQHLDYKALIQKFSQRFGPKKRSGLKDVLGITQAANEEVLAFRDRLLIAAKPLLPAQVPRKRLLPQGNTFKEVDNPEYEVETIRRNAALQQHNTYLVQFFLAGLRKEILDRLQSTDFSSLDDAAEAATQAEEYLRSVRQLQYSHNVSVDSLVVNAASAAKPLNDMERRGVPRGRPRTRSTDSDVCFKCNRKGHWSKDCPQGNRSSSRGRSDRSNSRGRQSQPKSDSLHDKIDNLVELISKMVKNGPSRSHSRDRSRSRSKPRQGNSQSGSRYNSRNGSKTRSNSRGSHKNQGNRQQSRSRSQSKNGRR
jgi:hypothetical protein